ncbi:hypothetical protein [Pseudokineococcus sp. 1T1Z-3]|uniref:hypothetical protein n=1 Tax=Pseudokineococcus sp. 1T1Z-3 TaxID=3132745 RepID=UPI0030961D39
MWSDKSGDPSTDDDGERWQRTYQRPDNEVGVPVPLSLVLARTEDTAVVLTSVLAYSTGFAFDVAVRLRQPPPDDRDLFWHGFGRSTSADSLLLGVEYVDGRRRSVLDVDDAPWSPSGRANRAAAEAGPLTLVGGGGGGGGRTYDHSWWVHPLPPPGPVRVVVRWDAQGLAESVTEVDGAGIADAGARAEALWPWEPERRRHDVEAPSPARPSDGWFATP